MGGKHPLQPLIHPCFVTTLLGLSSQPPLPFDRLQKVGLHHTRAPPRLSPRGPASGQSDTAARGHFGCVRVTAAHTGTPWHRGLTDPGKAFFAGANWEQAGFIVRDNTFSFPSSCQLICKFIQSVSRSHHFAAFVILKDVRSACHRDLRNADYPNLVYALSKFSGGGVWQQAEHGTEWRFFLDTWMCGEVLPLQPGPALVHARTRYRFHLPSAPSVGESSLVSGKSAKRKVQVQDTPIGGQQVQQVQLVQQVQQAQVASQEASQASRLEQQGCQAFLSPQEVEVISSNDEHQKGALQVQSEEHEEPFNPTLSGSFGQPMICRFEMCKRKIVDGFGLCSPGRWTPAARERLADLVQSGHARAIRGILERFVHEQLGDVKRFPVLLSPMRPCQASGGALQRPLVTRPGH